MRFVSLYFSLWIFSILLFPGVIASSAAIRGTKSGVSPSLKLPGIGVDDFEVIIPLSYLMSPFSFFKYSTIFRTIKL